MCGDTTALTAQRTWITGWWDLGMIFHLILVLPTTTLHRQLLITKPQINSTHSASEVLTCHYHLYLVETSIWKQNVKMRKEKTTLADLKHRLVMK